MVIFFFYVSLMHFDGKMHLMHIDGKKIVSHINVYNSRMIFSTTAS